MPPKEKDLRTDHSLELAMRVIFNAHALATKKHQKEIKKIRDDDALSPDEQDAAISHLTWGVLKDAVKDDKKLKKSHKNGSYDSIKFLRRSARQVERGQIYPLPKSIENTIDELVDLRGTYKRKAEILKTAEVLAKATLKEDGKEVAVTLVEGSPKQAKKDLGHMRHATLRRLLKASLG